MGPDGQKDVLYRQIYGGQRKRKAHLNVYGPVTSQQPQRIHNGYNRTFVLRLFCAVFEFKKKSSLSILFSSLCKCSK